MNDDSCIIPSCQLVMMLVYLFLYHWPVRCVLLSGGTLVHSFGTLAIAYRVIQSLLFGEEGL